MWMDFNLRTVFFEDAVKTKQDPWQSKVIPSGRYWVVELSEKTVALLEFGGGGVWIEMPGDLLIALWAEGKCKVSPKFKPKMRF